MGEHVTFSKNQSTLNTLEKSFAKNNQTLPAFSQGRPVVRVLFVFKRFQFT